MYRQALIRIPSRALLLFSSRLVSEVPAAIRFPSAARRYKRHVIVVGGGRVGIAVALALNRAANSAVAPSPEPFRVESLFTGPDSLNPSIRMLEERNQKKGLSQPKVHMHDLRITMLVRDPEIAISMQQTRRCAPYFPALRLPADIEVSSNAEKTMFQFYEKDAQDAKPKGKTLYPTTKSVNASASALAPISALFICVPYAALYSMFAPNGLLHCLTEDLPWRAVFTESPAMISFTRGIDEKMQLPYEILKECLCPPKEAKKKTRISPEFIFSQISGPFQPIELIDGKPISALITSGPCGTPEELSRAMEHEKLVASLLSCKSAKHLVFVHEFHKHNFCMHHAHICRSNDVPTSRNGKNKEAAILQPSNSCLHAFSVITAMKEFYCLLYGLLVTTWSAQNNQSGASTAMGSCTSAGAGLQVAFVNECAVLLECLGLPAAVAYTIGGMGDVAAGCGSSGGAGKELDPNDYPVKSTGSGLWHKLEAACRKHICDLHPLYLMGIRIAQGFPGSYMFQLKGKPTVKDSANEDRFKPSMYPYSPTPNAYAQYVVEGVENLVGLAESSKKLDPRSANPFPVLRACLKALKNDRRPRELANIVLRPDRTEIAYTPIDMENINNRDPEAPRHPFLDVVHVLSENVVRPTAQTSADEKKLRLMMPGAPPAMKNLFT